MPHAVVHGPTGDTTLTAEPGETMMQVARAAGLPVLGECNGSLACATCHVIVDPLWAAKLQPVSDDEEAMLDTVFDLKPTSRLSCQILFTDALDGLCVSLPA